MASIRLSGGDGATKLWTLLDWQASGKTLFVECPKCERTVLLQPEPLIRHLGAYSFIGHLAKYRCQKCHSKPDFRLRLFKQRPDPRQADLLSQDVP